MLHHELEIIGRKQDSTKADDYLSEIELSAVLEADWTGRIALPIELPNYD